MSLAHSMHTNACGFAMSWSSLMYLAPSDFFGFEHLTSSCRSAFDNSFSFSRRFIHGSGWWNGSSIRRRAVEASRTHLKSSRNVSIAPLATLRKRLPLFAATLVQLCEVTQAFFQQEQIGRKPSEFVQHLRISRVVATQESALSNQTSANAHSHVVNLRCGGRSGVQPSLNTEFQARNTQGICKLFTEVQRDT